MRDALCLMAVGQALALSLPAAAAAPRARVRCCAPPPPDGVRINKVFTSRFSRRETDRLVNEGRVTLNGAVATPGDRVQPGDTVALDGRPFEAAAAFAAAAAAPEAAGDGSDPFVYLKYWKPRGVTCTTDRRVADNIIDAIGPTPYNRLFPVGRLDRDSTGMILLTNDGRLPNAVNRAARAHAKLYVVRCSRPLADAHLRQLSRGVVITTVAQRDRGPGKPLTAPTRPCEVSRVGEREFRIVLTEGRNRQIRRMCEALGHRVVELHRESVMGVGLRGLRGPGEAADLAPDEQAVMLRAINDAAHANAAAPAGAPRDDGGPPSGRAAQSGRAARGAPHGRGVGGTRGRGRASPRF